MAILSFHCNPGVWRTHGITNTISRSA